MKQSNHHILSFNSNTHVFPFYFMVIICVFHRKIEASGKQDFTIYDNDLAVIALIETPQPSKESLHSSFKTEIFINRMIQRKRMKHFYSYSGIQKERIEFIKKAIAANTIDYDLHFDPSLMGPDEVGRNFIPKRIIIKNIDLNCDQFLGLVNISQEVIKILIPI